MLLVSIQTGVSCWKTLLGLFFFAAFGRRQAWSTSSWLCVLHKLWASTPSLDNVEHSTVTGHHLSPTPETGADSSERKGQMHSAMVLWSPNCTLWYWIAYQKISILVSANSDVPKDHISVLLKMPSASHLTGLFRSRYAPQNACRALCREAPILQHHSSKVASTLSTLPVSAWMSRRVFLYPEKTKEQINHHVTPQQFGRFRLCLLLCQELAKIKIAEDKTLAAPLIRACLTSWCWH